jgi:hypothetical protein
MTVTRADQQPGRRRAAPAPRRRVFAPASSRKAVVRLLLTSTTVGLLLCVAAWTPLHVPTWVPVVGAVVVSTSYAVAVAGRMGGNAVGSGLLAIVVAVSATVWSVPILLSGAAVATAVLAAVLGVMVTKPAARFRGVVREVLLATVVAVVGAFAVEAYQAPVSVDRADYVALGLALLGALGLVYRLGAGLQGLGRRGTAAVLGGIVLLFVALAYTEALAHWGTADLRHGLIHFIHGVHDVFGAVPRPTEFLLGFPALAWGVSTRARRRQGWWVAAFGAPGLAVIATTLLNPALSLAEAGLALLYSLLIGMVLGYLVVRIDAYATGNRGRRARRLEELSAHRPEPARTEPLL